MVFRVFHSLIILLIFDNSRLHTSFQIFISTSGKFVARDEGEGYNPTSKNNDSETVTYAVLLAPPYGNKFKGSLQTFKK